MIHECFAEAKPFGIPAVIKNEVSELGTIIEVNEIVEVYEDGKMDIRTMGLKVFRTLELVKSIPGKLFSGAIVNYPTNIESNNSDLMRKVLKSIRELHQLLNVKKDFKKPDELLSSYDIAHHAGLSLDQEYELLGLFNELQRLEYLKRHFKELKGFNFEL